MPETLDIHRQDLADRLPDRIQPFITWLSGIPDMQGAENYTMKPSIVIGFGAISILFGFALITAALISTTPIGVIPYIIGFCFVSGGMRRLDVLIIHQTLHSKVLKTPRANRWLGEFLTTLLLKTPYEENRRGHLGHHRAPCDKEDADVVFLRQAGVAMSERTSTLYLRILAITLSPIFHLHFTFNRLKANFVTARPFYRLTMAWLYLAVLAAPTFIFGTVYLQWLVALSIMPLTIGFQTFNFLYTATKHRWWLFDNKTVKEREKIDLLSYARVCCSPIPKNKRIINWIIWWAEALLVHTPTRLFIIVGDTVQHDLHHVAPTYDWANSAQERLKFKAKYPYRFTEVWGGYLAHLKECNLKRSSHDIERYYTIKT